MTSIVENINSSIRDVCLVCFQDTLHFQRAVAPCGHDDICAQCHIRLRSLHNDKKCPICKSDNAMLVVDTETTHLKSFADYEIWGNELGGNFTFQEDLGTPFLPFLFLKYSPLILSLHFFLSHLSSSKYSFFT